MTAPSHSWPAALMLLHRDLPFRSAVVLLLLSGTLHSCKEVFGRGDQQRKLTASHFVRKSPLLQLPRLFNAACFTFPLTPVQASLLKPGFLVRARGQGLTTGVLPKAGRLLTAAMGGNWCTPDGVALETYAGREEPPAACARPTLE